MSFGNMVWFESHGTYIESTQGISRLHRLLTKCALIAVFTVLNTTVLCKLHVYLFSGVER